jgi:hypothetical protein
MTRARTRWITSLLGLALGVSTLVAAGGAPAAAAATTVADRAHPFSDPVWFPIHAPVRAGCIGSSASNNGPRTGSNPCSHDHAGYWAMNISIPWKLPGGRLNPQPHPAVYAAGAGVVIRSARGHAACVRGGGAVTPGNEVWIAHGGGIISVYQHLLAVNVVVGALVTQRTVIGTVGATGASCTAQGTPQVAYLDFQVRHNGGRYAENAITLPSMLGCAGTSTKAVIVPAAVPRSMYVMPAGQHLPATLPKTWIQVPFGAGINFASTDWNCVPANGHAAASPATGVRLTASGTTRVLSWSAAPGANRYAVQLQVLRNGSWIAPCSSYTTSGCNDGYYTLPVTSTPHLTLSGITGRVTYRVRPSVHNGVGWSAATAWVTIR